MLNSCTSLPQGPFLHTAADMTALGQACCIGHLCVHTRQLARVQITTHERINSLNSISPMCNGCVHACVQVRCISTCVVVVTTCVYAFTQLIHTHTCANLPGDLVSGTMLRKSHAAAMSLACRPRDCKDSGVGCCRRAGCTRLPVPSLWEQRGYQSRTTEPPLLSRLGGG
jgi:hypothetical protein